MSAYVFLGPSLPLATASAVLPATYLPPIQQGDILRLLEREPDIIGIVDGYFEVVPAVWHKEILLALEAGVRVYGAASMGAIRAAELHSFGMTGIGSVFEWLRDGVICRDDEVAIIHAPAELGYAPLSVALVDIRDACDAATREGIVAAPEAKRLIAAASDLPFPERSYDAVAQAIAGDIGPSDIRRWLAF